MTVDIKNLGYFLSRAMIKSTSGDDDYHQILGKDNFIEAISQEIDLSFDNNCSTKTTLDNIVSKLHSVSSGNENTLRKLSNFGNYLTEKIETEDDLKVLYAICSICAPTVNQALKRIPYHDQVKVAKNAAIKKLNEFGDLQIENLITNWDAFTYEICLAEENNLATEILTTIPELLDLCRYDFSTDQKNHLISGSLQEYERRAGQKRKPRAGDDLQQSVEVILGFLKVKFDPTPQLVSGILEADLIIKHGRYKCIVSCKRTGRERVKQIAVDTDTLKLNRIRKIIWFFTEFDQTADRIEDLGLRESVFYLPDSSKEYKKYKADPRTSPYIFPLSSIRKSLPQLVSGEITKNLKF